MLPNDTEAEQDDDEFKLLDDDDNAADPARKLAEYYTQRPPVASLTPTVTLPPPPPRHPFLSGIFTFPWYLGSLPVWIYMMFGLTTAALLVTFLYHIMHFDPTIGVVVGVPVGSITIAALSYTAVMYLHVVQQTAEGFDAIDDWPASGWLEWFWTLPSTLGVVGMAALVGWIFSSLLFRGSRIPIVAALLILYPVLQLCVLDSGSTIMPLSRRILRTFATHPVPWAIFYAMSLSLLGAFGFLCWLTFVDPPYVTMLFLAPVSATLILIYARLLGRLAASFDPEPGPPRSAFR
jgi:hypothetical protein